jgi:hypothetical protein
VSRLPLDVRALLPEVDLIADEDLRARVIEVWESLWEESAFVRPEDVPISPEVPYPHVPHNRAVVGMAISIADILERFHGVSVDRDVLVAAGLLQDVSKLVEMAPGDDGGVVETEIGALFPHAFWASHTALEHGLPAAVAEIVLNHTPQSAQFPRTLEGKILWYADQIDVIAVFRDRWEKRVSIIR